MCEEAPESMIHSVKWVQSDLATAANSCARRRSVLPSFFFAESLTCDPGVFCVPRVLTGVTNRNACVTCHTRHTSVTDFRPKLGNPMEVTLMTSPKLYIVSHAKGTDFP